GYGTTQARQTTFAYDDLGRVTSVTPPGGVPTVTDYASDLSWVRTTRGDGRVQTSLDGFGRPLVTSSGTVAAFDAKVVTTYYPDGRVHTAGLPVASGATTWPAATFVYDDNGSSVSETLAGQTRTRTHVVEATGGA